ncbi:MAG TPA: hypothetical protein VGM03_07350, partial [Phycisphaerae bacterium]
YSFTGTPPFDPGDLPLEELTDQPLFRCPSDRSSYQQFFTANPTQAFSAYDDVGTSYQMNFYWWIQTNLAPGNTDLDGDGRIEGRPGLCAQEQGGCGGAGGLWPCRFRQGREIWRKYAQKGAGKFVTMAEDPFDYAIVSEVRTLGFHGEYSRHNMAFLDTHVEYLKPNTTSIYRSEWFWTVINEDWEAPWTW